MSDGKCNQDITEGMGITGMAKIIKKYPKNWLECLERMPENRILSFSINTHRREKENGEDM
jgi:hypothetical protein